MYCETFYIKYKFFEDFGGGSLHRESGCFYYAFYVYCEYCEDFGRNILHRASGCCRRYRARHCWMFSTTS